MRFTKELVTIPKATTLRVVVNKNTSACVFRVIQDKDVYFCICYFPLATSLIKDVKSGDEVYIWGTIEHFYRNGILTYKWIVNEYKLK